MNVFYLDENPIKSAHYHCNAHVVKMITESAQLLSTCLRMSENNKQAVYVKGKLKHIYVHSTDVLTTRADQTVELTTNKLYIDTHHKHPCTVIMMQCPDYFKYVFELYRELCDIYYNSRGKRHGADFIWIQDIASMTFTNCYTPIKVPLAMPPQYIRKNAVESYRAYYKAKLNDWKNGTPRQQALYKNAYLHAYVPSWLL